MEVFWVLFIYLLLVKGLSTANRNRLLEAVLGALGVWFVLAFRSPYCGVDLVREGNSYYNVFLAVQDLSINSLSSLSNNMETGWIVYCYFFSLFIKDFSVFLAITALIQIIPIALVFFKYSRDITLSYIIYICMGLYVFAFSGLRQATAISITFISFHILQKNKKILFFLLVLLASTFHRSALVFLVVYFFRGKSLSLKKSVLYLLLLMAIAPFLRIIVDYLGSNIFNIRYLHYENEGGAITMFLVYIVLFLISYLNKHEDDNLHFVRWMILCSVGCQSLGIISTSAITRVGFYFSIFFPLLLTEIPIAFEKKSAMIVKLIASIALIFFFYLTTKNTELNVVPYYFVWERPL